jgi:hypothetical protein
VEQHREQTHCLEEFGEDAVVFLRTVSGANIGPDLSKDVINPEDGITIKIIRGDHRRVADPKFDCEVLAQSITPHAYGDAGLVIQ